MTKIFCHLCHRTDFGTEPATQHHLNEHYPQVHRMQITKTSQKYHRRRQDEEWERLWKANEAQLDNVQSSMEKQWAGFVNHAKHGMPLPKEGMPEELMKVHVKLANVDDDSDDEETPEATARVVASR